ncbi:uncharacterized protein MKK02DRAFT_37862 [Dioszegia hungarica]|uniref:F-box domain-containing protein n=1 Tax=Dioszegia hungarica TaxID=4972 RepID=A0AA38H7G1_9TREE|nr:uncharacterized protein MKK02DRAFT_37862 [Dioszegia hungarica]KAI9634986.1 hypothetical protein MKK02DRAFT_37862 [Dioszegia hungarica]
MFSDLPPELWPLLISHLRNPLPPTHTALPPPLSTLKQPHVVAAMMVSTEWYRLASSTLYSAVSEMALEGWKGASRASKPLPVFEKARTLSVGAFAGCPKHYRGSGGPTSTVRNLTEAAREYVGQFLYEHPQIRHTCDWAAGPLILNDSVIACISDKQYSAPSITAHSFAESASIPHFETSYIPTRRYFRAAAKSESPSSTGGAIVAMVVAAIAERQSGMEDLGMESDEYGWNLEEDVYVDLTSDSSAGASSARDRASRRKQAADFTGVIEGMLAASRAALPTVKLPHDSWTVTQLFDAPRCEACGWEPEGTEERGVVEA